MFKNNILILSSFFFFKKKVVRYLVYLATPGGCAGQCKRELCLALARLQRFGEFFQHGVGRSRATVGKVGSGPGHLLYLPVRDATNLRPPPNEELPTFEVSGSRFYPMQVVVNGSNHDRARLKNKD